MTSIARAKTLADEWAARGKDELHSLAVCTHFDHVGPGELIKMWESGKRLDGKRLSQFETQALAERWCAVFGELPPDDDSGDAEPQEPSAPEPELPADDTMLSAKDVVRITGISLSTIKRMVLASRFPQPMRLSPRRLGWPARDVKAWLDGLDTARQKARV
jgi:predicted DNA-binding transcriptional regulator AlpA